MVTQVAWGQPGIFSPHLGKLVIKPASIRGFSSYTYDSLFFDIFLTYLNRPIMGFPNFSLDHLSKRRCIAIFKSTPLLEVPQNFSTAVSQSEGEVNSYIII